METSEKAELVREGKHEDTYVILPGQLLMFECDLGTTGVAGRYRLTLEYKIERLTPAGEEVKNP